MIRKIFKAFLEVKFEGRPGYTKVIRGEYEVFSDRINGQFINRKKWTQHVKPKSRLVMSMILSRTDSCKKCNILLVGSGLENKTW
jgi:hypothetical protein